MFTSPDPIAFRHLPDLTGDPERILDLHRLVVTQPSSTFFMRAGGDAPHAAIRAGDLLVVDRAVTPCPDAWVVAVSDDRLVLCRLTAGVRTEVWGVVTALVRLDPAAA